MEKYTFEDLLDIMRKLRSENGCPWDREQTHSSIKKYAIEEAYEVADAVDTGNPAAMADELGDLLLQIVFHAQIGAENKTFTIDDVIGAVCKKMIKRHPHVFGDVKADTADEVLTNWEKIKKDEKGQTTTAQTMREITKSLPGMIKAQKIQEKAVKAGYSFGDIPKCENVGKALFDIINFARESSLSAEEELQSYNNSFIEEFSKKGFK